jgi:hypothetical protein
MRGGLLNVKPLEADNLTRIEVVDNCFVACENGVGFLLMILQ